MRLEDIASDSVRAQGFIDYWNAVLQLPRELQTPPELQKLTAQLLEEAPRRYGFTVEQQKRYALGANNAIPFLYVKGHIVSEKSKII